MDRVCLLANSSLQRSNEPLRVAVHVSPFGVHFRIVLNALLFLSMNDLNVIFDKCPIYICTSIIIYSFIYFYGPETRMCP